MKLLWPVASGRDQIKGFVVNNKHYNIPGMVGSVSPPPHERESRGFAVCTLMAGGLPGLVERRRRCEKDEAREDELEEARTTAARGVDQRVSDLLDSAQRYGSVLVLFLGTGVQRSQKN